jgi:hypothetical protein
MTKPKKTEPLKKTKWTNAEITALNTEIDELLVNFPNESINAGEIADEVVTKSVILRSRDAIYQKLRKLMEKRGIKTEERAEIDLDEDEEDEEEKPKKAKARILAQKRDLTALVVKKARQKKN